MDFQTALVGAIGNPANNVDPDMAAKVKAILDGPPSLRKHMILASMERHVRAHLAVEGVIDWSKVNWAEVLGFVLKLLVVLIPLL